MNFPQFEKIADMLIDGMKSAVAISHGRFTDAEYSEEIAKLILNDLHANDGSLNYAWSEQQCPGLEKVLEEDNELSPESILKLAAPGLLALSADSADRLKVIVYQYSMQAMANLAGATK